MKYESIEHELLVALKELRKEVHDANLLDVKKRFSLCTADAMAGTAIHHAEEARKQVQP